MSHQPAPTADGPPKKKRNRAQTKKRKASDSVAAHSPSEKLEKTSTSPIAVDIASTSRLTLDICNIRPPPPIVHYPEGPPSKPKLLSVRHPANDRVFLELPAYDQLPGPIFGVHHETLLIACKIIAGNSAGYLSKSRDRDIDTPLDSVLIPDTYYYYHLDDCDQTDLYPICNDFHNWHFPHNKMPSSWEAVPKEIDPVKWAANWTALSLQVKARDGTCLISRYPLALTTAHVVNKEDNYWLDKNHMNDYLPTQPVHQSPRNLFCLRCDLHIPLFDQAYFAIVPKSGKLVVHFLRPGSTYANQFHNVVFDHDHNLSHEALYARFAWALMKIVEEFQLSPKDFKFFESEGKGKGKGPKPGGGSGDRRRTRDEDGGEDGDNEDDVEGDGGDYSDTSGTYQPTGSTTHQINPELLSLQSDSWLHDVLHRMAPSDDRSLLEADKREIEDDLRRAARDHPFFVDPSIEPTPYKYENIFWYPGMKVVERRKRAYLNSHPNIRAQSISNPGYDSY